MGQKSGDAPVFSVYNRSVTAGTLIVSNIVPFVSGYTMSCFLDFDVITNPTTGYGRLYKLIACYPYKRFTVGKDSGNYLYLSFDWQQVRHNEQSTKSTPGRKRIAVFHEADSNLITFKYKDDNGDLITFQYTTTFVETTEYLKLGGSENTDHSLPPGTVNSFEVYDKIMDSDFVDNFFA